MSKCSLPPLWSNNIRFFSTVQQKSWKKINEELVLCRIYFRKNSCYSKNHLFFSYSFSKVYKSIRFLPIYWLWNRQNHFKFVKNSPNTCYIDTSLEIPTVWICVLVIKWRKITISFSKSANDRKLTSIKGIIHVSRLTHSSLIFS